MPHIEDVTDEFEASSLLEKSGAREAAEEGDCSHSAKHTADDGSKPDDAAASGVTVSNGGDKSTTDVAPKKLTEEDRERQEVLLEKARAIKQEGNTLFGEGQYEEALSKYTEAIEVAPDGHKEQAVYYNNRATCHFKLNRTDDVIADCSAALRIDSDYTKCLLRRAQAYEKEEKVVEAFDDFSRVLQLESANSLAKAACKRLEGPATAERERQKEEMMGKLKDLGNTVLGKFGLSLDNFKATQDPDTGGYSISFQQ